jgi:hypothetical protein
VSSSKDTLLNDHAQGCFDEAVAYRSAGDTLLQVLISPGNTLHLLDPIYFLYHHATELALKAFLLSHSLDVPRGKPGHDIGTLFDRCRTSGLLGPADDNSELRTFVYLLGEGDRWYRYRYAGAGNERFIPDFAWVREAVGQLFEAVGPHVLAWAKDAPPGPARFRLAFPRTSLVKIRDRLPHVTLPSNSPAGTMVAPVSIVNSDGSPFTGTVTITDEAGNHPPVIFVP